MKCRKYIVFGFNDVEIKFLYFIFIVYFEFYKKIFSVDMWFKMIWGDYSYNYGF